METTAERVRRLIEESGLAQGAFAERVGIESTKLSKSLNGARRFSSLDLALIAEIGNVTVDWLLTGEEMSYATAARASKGSSAEVALALAQEYSTMRADLAAMGYVQRLRLPERVEPARLWVDQGNALAVAASRMITGTGLSVVDDLAEVIETTFGIDVSVQPLGEGFDGLAVATAEGRFIIVATTPIAARQRFTMAHELGHLLASDDQRVHQDRDIYSTDSRRDESEVRANAFASALLMPEQLVRDRLDGRAVDVPSLCGLATDLRVSPSALAVRLEKLDIIDAATRDVLRDITGKEAARIVGRPAAFAQASAASMASRPPGSLLADSLTSYEIGQSTLRPYAQLLGVDSRVLRQQLGHIEETDI